MQPNAIQRFAHIQILLPQPISGPKRKFRPFVFEGLRVSARLGDSRCNSVKNRAKPGDGAKESTKDFPLAPIFRPSRLVFRSLPTHGFDHGGGTRIAEADEEAAAAIIVVALVAAIQGPLLFGAGDSGGGALGAGRIPRKSGLASRRVAAYCGLRHIPSWPAHP